MLVTLDRAANQKVLKQVLGKNDYKKYLKSPISLLEKEGKSIVERTV